MGRRVGDLRDRAGRAGNPATVFLGPDASSAQIARLTESLGLNRPMYEQYLSYLGDVLRLDFGQSHRLGRPAMEAVLERLPATIDLTVTATAIAVLVGLVLGLVAGSKPGRKPGSVVDRVVSAATIALQSFPTFWVGIMMILTFALGLRLLPSAGVGRPAHLVLPAVTLAEAGLSFLGIGLPTATVSWGKTIANGQQYLETTWWVSTLPGIVLSLLIIDIGILGDQLTARHGHRRRQN